MLRTVRAALVSLALATAALGSAQSVLLRYHPPVGKTASYTLVTSMTMTMPAAASSKPMHFVQTVPTKLRVLSKTATTTTVEMTTGPIRTDGMHQGAKGPGAATKPIVARLVFDEYGTPKEASGSGATATLMGGMGSAMGQGAGSTTFPKKAVKVGDTWTSSLDFGKIMGGAMPGMKMNGQIPVSYRLVALQGGVATIAMTAKGAISMDMGGKAMRLTMDMRSTSLVEVATGLAKSATTTADTMVAFPGMAPMHQRMTMTMK